MSRRTAEADKAIRKAWERERDLVQIGKGTRDWTKAQQDDILNPNVGKAKDEYGRAFEGQHMKSVAEYPLYQGDPNNIQFLTKTEHLEAHRGSWQNPTNWFYNPETKEYVEFGENEIIPCKVIDLSNPIVIASGKEPELETTDNRQKEKEEKQSVDKTHKDNTGVPSIDSESQSQKKPVSATLSEKSSVLPKAKQSDSRFEGVKRVARKVLKGSKRAIKGFGRFVVDNPELVAGVVINGIESVASNVKYRRNKSFPSTNTGSRSSNNAGHSTGNNIDPSISSQPVVPESNTDTRPYTPNDVGAGSQRYHYKDGSVRWKEKPPYHREGTGKI